MEKQIQCIPMANHRYEYLMYDEFGIFVIGRAVCTETHRATRVDLINVNHGFRGQGYGSQLLDAIIEKQGHKKLITETWDHLVAWYKRFGFEIITHKGNIYHLERVAAQ